MEEDSVSRLGWFLALTKRIQSASFDRSRCRQAQILAIFCLQSVVANKTKCFAFSGDCLARWKDKIVGCLTEIGSPSRILLSYLIEFNLWNQNFYPVEKAHNFYSIQFIYAGKFSISVTVFPTTNLQHCTLTAKVTTFATAIG